jgi:hypothetical protein
MSRPRPAFIQGNTTALLHRLGLIVICGRVHTEAIAAQLKGLRRTVEIIDLQDQEWYIEDWFGYMLKL